METVRNRLIHHGASVKMVDGVITIRLNASFPYQREVIEILQTLRQQVKIEAIHQKKDSFRPISRAP